MADLSAVAAGSVTEQQAPRSAPRCPVDAILSYEQAAHALGVSVKTVERLVRDRKIRSSPIGRRTRRFLGKHILDYLEAIAD